MLRLDIELQRGNFHRHVRIDDDARIVALTGPSGAGKTTVLNAIAGLVTPRSGRIEIDGRVLIDHERRIDLTTHRRRICYVFQESRLFPHLDVRRNLLYGRHGRGAEDRFGFDAVVSTELTWLVTASPTYTEWFSATEAEPMGVHEAPSLETKPEITPPERVKRNQTGADPHPCAWEVEP